MSINGVTEIFFEKQVSRLCAQHALNMLLQGFYFTAEYLAEVAKDLDQRECAVLSAEDRANFQGQNVDDSGFFSIQVIEVALKCHQLSLFNLDNPSIVEYKQKPSIGNAYICNLSEHWFTIRTFNRHWFLLNSTLRGPKPITDNYLDVYLAQLTNDGYSIFVIYGELPACPADHLTEADLDHYAKEFSSPSPASKRKKTKESVITLGDQADDDLAEAIALSLSQSESAEKPLGNEWDRAVERCLDQAQSSSRSDSSWPRGFGGSSSFSNVWEEYASPRKSPTTARRSNEEDEDAQLQRALRASLDDHIRMRSRSSEESREGLTQEPRHQEYQEEEDLRRAIQMSLEGKEEEEQQPCSSTSSYFPPPSNRHRVQSPLREAPLEFVFRPPQSSGQPNYTTSSSASSSSYSFSSTTRSSFVVGEQQERRMQGDNDSDFQLIEGIRNRSRARTSLMNNMLDDCEEEREEPAKK